MGAQFHYVHVAIVGGTIIPAVGNDLAIGEPAAAASPAALAVLAGGPALYLLGNGLFKTVIHRRFPLSHLIGLIGLAALCVVASLPRREAPDRVAVAALATVALAVAAAWEAFARRRMSRNAA